jgi:hypothetical protein
MDIDFNAHCSIPGGDAEKWLEQLSPESMRAIALNATHMRATRESCPSLPVTKAEIAEIAIRNWT